jgi:hypothetical protein
MVVHKWQGKPAYTTAIDNTTILVFASNPIEALHKCHRIAEDWHLIERPPSLRELQARNAREMLAEIDWPY